MSVVPDITWRGFVLVSDDGDDCWKAESEEIYLGVCRESEGAEPERFSATVDYGPIEAVGAGPSAEQALENAIARSRATALAHVRDLGKIFPTQAASEPTLCERLVEMKHEFDTQDNLITENPIFMVQEEKRTYGLDPDWTECRAWVNCEDDDEVVTLESDAARYDVMTAADDLGELPQGWQRVGYVDKWVHVQPFLTRKAALAYIKRNGHNHGKLRIYVESGYRNEEWAHQATLFRGAPAGARVDARDAKLCMIPGRPRPCEKR